MQKNFKSNKHLNEKTIKLRTEKCNQNQKRTLDLIANFDADNSKYLTELSNELKQCYSKI